MGEGASRGVEVGSAGGGGAGWGLAWGVGVWVGWRAHHLPLMAPRAVVETKLNVHLMRGNLHKREASV